MKKTVNCYEAALSLAQQIGEAAVLVHGIPLGQGPIEGVRFGHAWVEVNQSVIDPHKGVFLKREYYEVGRIEYTVRYEADYFMNLLKSEGCGPWDSKIQAAVHRD